MLRKLFTTSRSIWFIDTTLLWIVPVLLLVFGLPLLAFVQRTIGFPFWAYLVSVVPLSIFLTRMRVDDSKHITVTKFWLLFQRSCCYSVSVISVDFSNENDTEDPDVVVFDPWGSDATFTISSLDARRTAIFLRTAQNLLRNP